MTPPLLWNGGLFVRANSISFASELKTTRKLTHSVALPLPTKAEDRFCGDPGAGGPTIWRLSSAG